VNAVRIPITPELLASMLCLPDDSCVIGAEMSDDCRYVVLTVMHPTLPEVAEDAVPVTATPHYRKNYADTEPVVEFIDWGIEN
jgi:hypothetical protein